MKKLSPEKSAIVYGQHYYEFRNMQIAAIREIRKRPCFWYSWHNCMEVVLDVEHDLGYFDRHLPGVVEDELIGWLMEDFEG